MKTDKSSVDWQQWHTYQQAWMEQLMEGVQQITHYQQQVMENLNPSSQRKIEWNWVPWVRESAHFWSDMVQKNLNMSLQQFFVWNRQVSNYANLLEFYAKKSSIKNKPKE